MKNTTLVLTVVGILSGCADPTGPGATPRAERDTVYFLMCRTAAGPCVSTTCPSCVLKDWGLMRVPFADSTTTPTTSETGSE